MSNNEWLDSMLNNKISKEAMESQGTDKHDHFERKVKAHDWINGVTNLDPVQVEAEYQQKLRDEAMILGKTAALDDVIADGTTPEEVVNRDYKRDVISLSDYALAEMLAEARGHKAQNTSEMFFELKEKAKAEVASSRDKAEKALLEMIPDNAQLDWQKAFKAYTKDATPAEAKEKDLYKSDVPDKAHDFQHPDEDKFKLPKDAEKAIPGNGREADERKDVTVEAGVLQKDIVAGTSKEAALKCPDCNIEFSNDTSGNECANCGPAKIEDLKKTAAVHWTDAKELVRAVYLKQLEQNPTKFVNFVLGSMKDADFINEADLIVREAQKGAYWIDPAQLMPLIDEYKRLSSDNPNSSLNPTAKTAGVGCPVCGTAGTEIKTADKENMSCEPCALTYATEIDSQASKAEVMKKVAEMQKKAEVKSPWAIIVDPVTGKEAVACVDSTTTNIKESEEDKTEELLKITAAKATINAALNETPNMK